MIIKEYILFSDEQKHQANTVDLEDYLLRRGENYSPRAGISVWPQITV